MTGVQTCALPIFQVILYSPAHMGEREELRAGEYKITWKPVTSSRLDAAALRKALPEVAACFTRTSTARRFCVA